jgi:hypothetical protein
MLYLLRQKVPGHGLPLVECALFNKEGLYVRESTRFKLYKQTVFLVLCEFDLSRRGIK